MEDSQKWAVAGAVALVTGFVTYKLVGSPECKWFCKKTAGKKAEPMKVPEPVKPKIGK